MKYICRTFQSISDMNTTHLSEQEIIRRDKLEELRQLGVEPYPAALFPVSHYSADILQQYTEEKKEEFSKVTLAGRVMSVNDKGKVLFIKIQDSKGIIQLYVRRDDLCPGEDKTLFDKSIKHLLDLGDFIGVTGFVFITRTGETSIHTQSFTLLAKALKPLPVVKRDEQGNVFDEVTDPEFRYRQRYADLIVNPQVKEVFIRRTKMINAIRNFLNERGAIEVDTPVLQSIPGGAAARPFITHHNALDTDFYLRIANELYLKRLIVGGFDWVYEFSRNFRNEGMDRTHNPEFTVLEFYVAYKDYFWMMDTTEQLLEQAAIATNGSGIATVDAVEIDFRAPYRRITMYDAIKEYAGIDITDMDEGQLREACRSLNIHADNSWGKGKLIDELFSSTCERHFIQPTFIIDYPVEMSPLTKKHRSRPGLVERFELIVNGKEIANAYSELNDPLEQRERFEEQLKLMERGDDEAMFIDHDFLRALEYGMPPTAGIGFGIDRICMLLTGQPSIQDVLLFPQLRPERTPEETLAKLQP
jgi:lysyl-tRNA synthetase class 2